MERGSGHELKQRAESSERPAQPKGKGQEVRGAKPQQNKQAKGEARQDKQGAKSKNKHTTQKGWGHGTKKPHTKARHGRTRQGTTRSQGAAEGECPDKAKATRNKNAAQ